MSTDNITAGMALLRNMHAGIDFAANARTRRERQERYAGCLNMFATLTGRDVYEVDAEVNHPDTELATAYQRADQ